MLIRTTNRRLLSVNVVADFLYDISGVEANIASVRESGNPTERRSVVSSFEEQLVGFVRSKALQCISALQVELVIAHANAALGGVAHFINALHHLNSMREGSRVFVDAV